MKYTPTPWIKGTERSNEWMIYPVGQNSITDTPIALARFLKGSEDIDLAIANAEFIVHAVNAHDALLEACKKAKEALQYHPKCNDTKGRTIEEIARRVNAEVKAELLVENNAIECLRAAIAKAGGG